jgi:hypothetical protein
MALEQQALFNWRSWGKSRNISIDLRTELRMRNFRIWSRYFNHYCKVVLGIKRIISNCIRYMTVAYVDYERWRKTWVKRRGHKIFLRRVCCVSMDELTKVLIYFVILFNPCNRKYMTDNLLQMSKLSIFQFLSLPFTLCHVIHFTTQEFRGKNTSRPTQRSVTRSLNASCSTASHFGVHVHAL